MAEIIWTTGHRNYRIAKQKEWVAVLKSNE